MKEKSLGFIGAGRVTRIFLQALKNRQVSFKSINLIDTNTDVINRMKKDFPEVNVTSDDITGIMKSDIVFIALHPPVIMEMLEKVKPLMGRTNVLVSLAPKITIEKISLKLDGFNKIARLIPNAPSAINEGYNPVCFSNGISEDDTKFLTELFEVLGTCIVVDEPKLEAYAIITAMSPTYFWFQFQELVEIGRKMGLTEEECKEGISETVRASLNTLFSSGMPADEVIDLIPVKPISEFESQIKEIYNSKLIPLFEKIKP